MYVIASANKAKTIGKCVLNPSELKSALSSNTSTPLELKLESPVDKKAFLSLNIVATAPDACSPLSFQQASIASPADTSASKDSDNFEDTRRKYSVKTIRKLQTSSNANVKNMTCKSIETTSTNKPSISTNEALLVVQLKRRLADEAQRHRQLLAKLEQANKAVTCDWSK